MGGSDTFCSCVFSVSPPYPLQPPQLTGGCYYTDNDIISGWVVDACSALPLNDPLRPADSVIERLKYTARDVRGSQDLVLLVPKDENGELDIMEYDGPIPTEYSDSTVAAVVNFTIGDAPDLSAFKIVSPSPNDPDVDVWMYGGYNKFYIFLYAHRILIGRFPELEPWMIYATLMSGEYDDEEYSKIEEQYAWFYQVGDAGEEEPEADGSLEKWESFWLRLLTAEGKSEDEIVREAWFGKGRMYHFACADDFPAAEPFTSFPAAAGNDPSSFSKLPFDVLDYLCITYLSISDASSLLCLNRSLRASLLPFIDTFAQKAVKRRHPYWLPVVAPCLRGQEEQEIWDAKGVIPWAPYARECVRSPSMRNRERIWGMAGRFRELVEKQGWLDGRTTD